MHEVIWLVGVFFKPLGFFLHTLFYFPDGRWFSLVLQPNKVCLFFTSLFFHQWIQTFHSREKSAFSSKESSQTSKKNVFENWILYSTRGKKKLFHAIHPSQREWDGGQYGVGRTRHKDDAAIKIPLFNYLL